MRCIRERGRGGKRVKKEGVEGWKKGEGEVEEIETIENGRRGEEGKK